jgi:DNA-binding beta-propeller fold protein YncE
MSKQRPYKPLDMGLYLAVCVVFIPLFWFITSSVITYRYPVALTTDREGNIYVAEIFQNEIRKFSPEGNFKVAFGGEGSQLKHFASGPYGVAVDGRGNVYGISTSDKSVKKFERQGNYVRRWLAVNAIRGLAADSAGNFYLALQDMAIVFQYDEAGNLAKEIDVTKDLPSISPKANLNIFVDAQNTLYVTER